MKENEPNSCRYYLWLVESAYSLLHSCQGPTFSLKLPTRKHEIDSYRSP